MSVGCLVMEGEWLERVLMHTGELLGLRYGQNFPELRPKVASKKFARNRLLSVATFKRYLLMMISFFLKRSICDSDTFLITEAVVAL